MMTEHHPAELPSGTDKGYPPRKTRRTRWGQSSSEVAVEQERPTDAQGGNVWESRKVSSEDTTKAEVKTQDEDVAQEASEISAEAKPAIVAAVTAVAAAGAVAGSSTSHLLPPGVRLLAKPIRTASTGSTATSVILSDVATRAAVARAALEKAKKALALQKQIYEQVSSMGAGKPTNPFMARGTNAIVTAGVAAVLRALPQAKPLRFDRLGRQVDVEGKIIEIKPVAHSTLKVNINKEREAKLKQVAFQARVDRNLTNPAVNPWFDASLGIAGPKIRSKGLSFVEKGFYAKRERQMQAREQAQHLNYKFASETMADHKHMENVSNDQKKPGHSLVGEQTTCLGGSVTTDHETKDSLTQKFSQHQAFFKHISDDSDTYFDPFHKTVDSGMARRQEALHILQRRQLGIIPDIEWWDQPLLRRLAEVDRLDDEDPDFPYVIAETAITDLVEHPVPIPPVIDAFSTAPPVMYLTTKERQKLRRRKRQDAERDKQDKIRMGLMPPPPPKVKLANLMRVLGESAASNPSKTESQVREQVAARLKAHQERNEARRLDAESRRKKNISKWTQPSGEVLALPGGAEVCIFSVKDLSDKKYLYKVDKNAQQYHVTGGAILCPPYGNLIIAEGTRKALRNYKKLLLHRVKWPTENLLDSTTATVGDYPPSTFSGVNTQSTKESPKVLNEVLQGRGGSFCKVLWEGVVKERAFKQWRVYDCKAEVEVRKILADRHSEHYWDILRKYRDPCDELL